VDELTAKPSQPFGCDVEIDLDPPKDGNCQFASLAKQLNLLGFGHWTHSSLRQELTSFLKTSKFELKEFVPERNDVVYLHQMSTNRCFGDNITLVAAAKRFEVQVVVLSSVGANYTRVISPDSCDKFCITIPTVLLGHYPEQAGKHYVSLIPTNGRSFQKIVSSRVSSMPPFLCQPTCGDSSLTQYKQ